MGDAENFSDQFGFSIEDLTKFDDSDNKNFLDELQTREDFINSGLENGLSFTIMKKPSQEIVDVKKKVSLLPLSQ